MFRTAVAAMTVLSCVLAGCSRSSPGDPAAEASGAKRIDGFSFLRLERFKCGDTSREVAIYRCDAIATALGLESDATATDCEFVLIPSGLLNMGSAQTDDYPWEGPVHEVHVDEFLLARTEVTCRVWAAVAPRADLPTHPAGDAGGDAGAVSDITWIQAVNWSKAIGLRLPSEAEWERACRGGTNTAYFFGEEPADWDLYVSRWGGEVAQKLPNAFGLHDMLGSMGELVADCFHPSYDGAPVDGSAWTEPCDGGKHVLRGTCDPDRLNSCRCAVRKQAASTLKSTSVGFRPVRTVPR